MAKDEKIYMAGGLFTSAQWRERKREFALLIHEIDENKKANFDIFSPINSEVNDKSTLPTSEMIFQTDYDELMASTIVFADMSDEDPGVMYELGLIHDHKDIKVYAYDSDIRTAGAGDYEGIRVPVSKNQFCVGGVFVKSGNFYNGFDEALEAFKKDYLI